MWSSLFVIRVDMCLPQTAQFDKNINIFCLVFLTFEFRSQYIFYNWHNTFPLLLIIRQYFCSNKFLSFWFYYIIWFNPNDLVEIVLISVFIVDCLMCLNISMIALKISKCSSSGSILMNLQTRSYHIALLLLS